MKTMKSEPRSIRSRLRGLLSRAFDSVRVNVVTVPISKCRHYCAFRYGCGSFNPYENYIIGIHEGKPHGGLRHRFEDFLMYFRPRNFGEVFGIQLSRHVPLWVYPWRHGQSINPNNGWLDDIDEVPDIITHFCEQGIRRSRINEEYLWLEQAYTAISIHSYRPHDNSFIEAFELKKGNENVYILTDGNHRVSALAALGHEEVMIKVTRIVRWPDESHKKWPQVRLGTYSEQDALDLVNVYFAGVDSFRRTSQSAKIIED